MMTRNKPLEAVERHLHDLERQLLTHSARMPRGRHHAIQQRIRAMTRARNRLLAKEYRRLESRLWDIAETLGYGEPFLHANRPR